MDLFSSLLATYIILLEVIDCTQVHNVIVTLFLCSYILMGCRLSSSFCVSGSEDCTLKVWRLPEDLKEDGNREPVHMKVSFTEKAHDKVLTCTVTVNCAHWYKLVWIEFRI